MHGLWRAVSSRVARNPVPDEGLTVARYRGYNVGIDRWQAIATEGDIARSSHLPALRTLADAGEVEIGPGDPSHTELHGGAQGWAPDTARKEEAHA